MHCKRVVCIFICLLVLFCSCKEISSYVNSDSTSASSSQSTQSTLSGSEESSELSSETSKEKVISNDLTDIENLIGLSFDRNDQLLYGKSYKKLCSTIFPYMITNAFYNLEYPNNDPASQPKLLFFIVMGMEDGDIPVSFDYKKYQNKQTGLYTIPCELLDPVISSYLGNLELDKEYLMQEGYMTADQSAYTVVLEGFGMGCRLIKIKDISMLNKKDFVFVLDMYFDDDVNPYEQIYFELSDLGTHFKINKVSLTLYSN